MQLQSLPLAHLIPHPANANVMPPELFDKLVAHIERTGRYPPILVRPLHDEPPTLKPGPESSKGRGPHAADLSSPDVPALRYQILDGHHRVKALALLGRTEARCVVWDVDDAEALLLMATLNRLQGRDDPRKRAALVGQLARLPGLGAAALARHLPETLPDLEALMALNDLPAQPRPPRPLADMPVAVHFFLLPAQRDALEARLRAAGGGREEALMELVASR